MSRREVTFPRRQPSLRLLSSAYCILNTIRIGPMQRASREPEIPPYHQLRLAEAEMSPDA